MPLSKSWVRLKSGSAAAVPCAEIGENFFVADGVSPGANRAEQIDVCSHILQRAVGAVASPQIGCGDLFLRRSQDLHRAFQLRFNLVSKVHPFKFYRRQSCEVNL